MMFNADELVESVGGSLSATGYTSDMDITVPGVRTIYFVQRPLIMKVRNLCAFIDLPEVILDWKTAREFFEFIRRSLMQKYGDAVLWKELELCFIVFCEAKSFKMLETDGDKVVKKGSFELESMLGTFFINKENYNVLVHSPKGLHFSKDHLNKIKDHVFKWCQAQKDVHDNGRTRI